MGVVLARVCGWVWHALHSSCARSVPNFIVRTSL